MKLSLLSSWAVFLCMGAAAPNNLAPRKDPWEHNRIPGPKPPILPDDGKLHKEWIYTKDSIKAVPHHKANARDANPEEVCSVASGMGWMAHASMVDSSLGEEKQAESLLAEAPSDQGGPLVMTVRVMMEWIKLLQGVRFQLEHTWRWPTESQFLVAQCWTDFSVEFGMWLDSLARWNGMFHPAGKARCLLNHKLRILYNEYQLVCMRLFGHKGDFDKRLPKPYKSLTNLLDRKTPKYVPEFWHAKLGNPKPGENIGQWVQEHDAVYAAHHGGKMVQAIKAWYCEEPDTKELHDCFAYEGDWKPIHCYFIAAPETWMPKLRELNQGWRAVFPDESWDE